MEPSDNTPNFDPRQADLNYAGFPSFDKWASCSVDTTRWETYASRLKGFRQQSSQVFSKALRIVTRAAAVETGAIENLYETDRGFTFTVAMEMATWEAAVAAKGYSVRPLLEAQFKAYEYVLDFATGNTPITEAWIRQLHEVICEGQTEYQVWTEVGPQKHLLPKGKYKIYPNHPLLPDGKIHSYAPVEMTPSEMYRLCRELESDIFKQAHCVLQAAYAHYAFVAIHPFADGNGRVARALASVFTLRAESVPVLILADTRGEYYDALQAADRGEYQPFVDFMFERSLDAIQLASDGFEAALTQGREQSVEQLESIYKTKGGYQVDEVDIAGFEFLKMLMEAIKGKTEDIKSSKLRWRIDTGDSPHLNYPKDYRKPVRTGDSTLIVQAEAQAPASVNMDNRLVMMVPTDPDKDDTIQLQNVLSGETYSARIKDLLPMPNTLVQLRGSLIADTIISKMISEIAQKIDENLKQQGYK